MFCFNITGAIWSQNLKLCLVTIINSLMTWCAATIYRDFHQTIQTRPVSKTIVQWQMSSDALSRSIQTYDVEEYQIELHNSNHKKHN